MGLTRKSTGKSLDNNDFIIKKKNPNDYVIAIAGNPNVGKSTLFNGLTGLKQHTGNWAGKTVSNAQGYLSTEKNSYVLVDIPGTYSLYAHSSEEEVARNFLCFGENDGVVIVCDAGCLERNLNLVLQITEITNNVLVCVNLIDEAEKKDIRVDTEKLSKLLGVSVVGIVARKNKGIEKFKKALNEFNYPNLVYKCNYPKPLILAKTEILKVLQNIDCKNLNKDWLSIRILENDETLLKEIEKHLGFSFFSLPELTNATEKAYSILKESGINKKDVKDIIALTTLCDAEKIANECVIRKNKGYNSFDKKVDKFLTGKFFGYLTMLILLGFIFWLTIWGANYISEYLSLLFNKTESLLSRFLLKIGCSVYLHNIITQGLFRIPAWVVSVMLPPMAIFFPLFTLLEDLGYLPRIAYNLDKPFKRCNGCGKQALTMCMGFGCNAAGIIGCRIIDSKRERLLGILTNSLVPCNGRFPALISLISMFFVTSIGIKATFLSSIVLMFTVLLGIFATFALTKFLSVTFLKGEPSSYTLELPPYRTPQPLKILVRSVFDRTIFVLSRSLTVAIPAGIIIWLLSNTYINSQSLLHYISQFLEPLGSLMGLDGIILLSFILGFPANEIVIPIIIMGYLSTSSISDAFSLEEIKNVFLNNGWTLITAINTIVFTLFHWPCSTTVLTIKKETGSLKWTALSVILPTVLGFLICIITNFLYKLFI